MLTQLGRLENPELLPFDSHCYVFPAHAHVLSDGVLAHQMVYFCAPQDMVILCEKGTGTAAEWKRSSMVGWKFPKRTDVL